MAKKIDITETQWQEVREMVYSYQKEFLLKALNAAMRALKQKQVSKKGGHEISHGFVAQLVYLQIRRTCLCDDDGLSFWIDSKGEYKIRLSPNLLGPVKEE